MRQAGALILWQYTRPYLASPSTRGPNASTSAAATLSVALASSMPAALSVGTGLVLIAVALPHVRALCLGVCVVRALKLVVLRVLRE